MKKYALLLFILLIPFNVKAANYNTQVSSDVSYQDCIDFQDNQVPSGTSGYYGHCVKATCYGGVWETQIYLSNNMVTCANGNTSKYYHVISDGCTPYIGSCAASVNVRYCTAVAEYDCNKNADGSVYIVPGQTTTTTKKVVPKTTTTTTSTKTTTTTTTAKNCNNYLKSLSLSNGKIEFNKNTFTYNVSIPSNTKKLTINATAEYNTANIKIENNDPINFNTPIIITVSSDCEAARVYTINLTATKDNNTKLSSIKIKNYSLNFDADKTNYSLRIGKDVQKIDITVKTDSEAATYKITGNTNLKNNSIIKINVTAENGDKNTYSIKIKKGLSFAIILIIILISFVIIYVLYKLIKKLIEQRRIEESDKGYEYE